MKNLNFVILLAVHFLAACAHKAEPAPTPTHPVTATGPIRKEDQGALQIRFNDRFVRVLNEKAEIGKYSDAQGGSIFLFFKDGNYLGKDHPTRGRLKPLPAPPYCSVELGFFKEQKIASGAWTSRVHTISVILPNPQSKATSGISSLMFWDLENPSVVKEISCTNKSKNREGDTGWMTYDTVNWIFKDYLEIQRVPPKP